MALRPAITARAARLIAAALPLALAACAAATPAPSATPAAVTAVVTAASIVVTTASATYAPTASPVPATATAAPAPTTVPAASPTPVPVQDAATPPAPATAQPMVHLMAVGDLMLGRRVGERIQRDGPEVVFRGVASTLGQADLVAANLECVISDQGQPQFKSYTFRAPVSAVQALSDGGIAVVGLANNHSMDYGLDGLADMLTRLRVAGVNTVGAGADAEAARAPIVLDRNGVHVAFLSYVNVPVESRTAFDTRLWAADVEKPGVAWGDPDAISHDVTAARTLADIVVVLLHSGSEGSLAVNPIQQSLAHAAVDAGAALVLGSHSHTLQPVEHYKDGLIVYSLGNFVFDGFLPPSNFSAIFSANLSPRGVDSYTWVPVVVEDGLPRLATSAEAAQILPMVREG